MKQGKTLKLLDVLHSPTDGKKPRTYRKRARKDYHELERKVGALCELSRMAEEFNAMIPAMEDSLRS